MQTSPLAAWVSGTVLILTVLAGIFVLAWHGTVPGSAVVGIVSTIVGIAGGILGVHTGVKTTNSMMVRRERD